VTGADAVNPGVGEFAAQGGVHVGGSGRGLGAVPGAAAAAAPVRAENLATWAYVPQLAVGLVPRLAPGGQVSGGPGCDDLRLVGLKLIFLIVSRTVSLAVLGGLINEYAYAA